MGYKPNNQEYILENDVEDLNNSSFEREMKEVSQLNDGLPDGYEIQQPVQQKSVMDELQEAAEQEGLVTDTLGGENPTTESVIKAMKEEGLSAGAQKNKEEHEKKKVEEFIKITATRDLLMNRTKRTIPVHIKTKMEIPNPETGEYELQSVDLEFKVRRLTESENTHLLNHKLIGKELSEMTDEEYLSSSHFRSELLAQAVVEPAFTAEEWRTEVDNGMITAIYDKVNEILTSADDSVLFQ